jgi:hypothetical protein
MSDGPRRGRGCPVSCLDHVGCDVARDDADGGTLPRGIRRGLVPIGRILPLAFAMRTRRNLSINICSRQLHLV